MVARITCNTPRPARYGRRHASGSGFFRFLLRTIPADVEILRRHPHGLVLLDNRQDSSPIAEGVREGVGWVA